MTSGVAALAHAREAVALGGRDAGRVTLRRRVLADFTGPPPLAPGNAAVRAGFSDQNPLKCTRKSNANTLKCNKSVEAKIHLSRQN